MRSLLTPGTDFLYAPTEPAAATPAPATTPEPAAAATPTEPVVASTPSATTATPVPDAGTTPAAASTPAAAPQASWLDSFRSEGFQATDETTARQQLLQAYRDAERLRPLAPALTTYQQHAPEFTKWLADKQRQAAPPAVEDWTKKLGWNPPPYDPAWQHQIIKDDKGNLTPAPGAPADVVMKYQAAQQFRQEQIEKFLQNPFEFMAPAIKHVATQIATQHAEQNVNQYREQQEVQQFITQHSDWLFDKGDKGEVKTRQVLNPSTGRYENEKVLSKYGRTFVQSLQQAAQSGLSPEMQQDYALKTVQNEYMASDDYMQWVAKQMAPAAPAAPAASPRQAANAAFTQRANPAAPPASTARGNAVTAPRQVNRENLAEIMLQRIQEAGASTN